MPHPIMQLSRPSRGSASTGGVTPGPGGRLWVPAPQPSVSIDALTPFVIVNGILASSQWSYVTGQSAPDTAVLASASFACYLLASLLALGSAARLSAEFGREFTGYNVPHARRTFVWHRSVAVAFVFFYLGSACMVATAVLALATSRRLLSGLILGVVGGGAIVGAAVGTWSMLVHPLGVDTSERFSGPAAEADADGGEEEGADWTGPVVHAIVPSDPAAGKLQPHTAALQASPHWVGRETTILATAAPGGRRSQSLAAMPRYVRFEAGATPAGSPTGVLGTVGSVRSGPEAHVPPPRLSLPVPTHTQGEG